MPNDTLASMLEQPRIESTTFQLADDLLNCLSHSHPSVTNAIYQELSKLLNKSEITEGKTTRLCTKKDYPNEQVSKDNQCC